MPCLLHGYGAYGISISARSAAIGYLRRFVYAIRARVRRQRERKTLVSRRQADQEDEHIYGFHLGQRKRLMCAGKIVAEGQSAL
jgi:hypothetical protein